ncbi:type II toxin-antitoxin system VapB family antitoxin [Geodermatophilus saharensis]|uniref:type II toxin-antitoxin system VapB family antitoxin n=1 Tax=Geodermatophilus saharensis TaxID=1137994 RepID=UPI003CCC2C94
MARRTCRRRSSCATVTPPRTGRRRRAGGPGCAVGARRPPCGGLALARTECQTSIREGPRPPLRPRARGGPPDGAERITRTVDRVTADGAGTGWVRTEVGSLIFKAVRDGRPYPEHGLAPRDWAMIPPRQIRLDTLVTTKRELALDTLLADDSTFYGDLFPHAVQWHGDLYLEDGLHRALRAALQQRTVIHVRVLDLDALMPADPAR